MLSVTQQEPVGWTAIALRDGEAFNYVDVARDDHARSVFTAVTEAARNIAGG